MLMSQHYSRSDFAPPYGAGNGSRQQQAGFAGYLTKPLRQAALRKMLSVVMGREHSAEGRQQPIVTRHALLRPTRRNVRILLAEDNVSNQKVAQAMLKKLGYRADAVANGVEAIEALSRIPYDLVLMDCQMPEMDGLEASRRIREASSGVLNPGVTIIAMTANAMQGDRERCIKAGMDDYLPKPVQPRELAELLDRWLPPARKHGDRKKVPPEEAAPHVPLGHTETTKRREIPVGVETEPSSPGPAREEPFATAPANAAENDVFDESSSGRHATVLSVTPVSAPVRLGWTR